MIKEVALQTLYPKKNKSLNPANFEDETFALYSIGAYDKGKPDIIKGKEIGSSKKMLEPNDVILSRIVPHIQRCWVVPQKNDYIQIGSGEWIVFRNEKIHPNYLRYYLISKPFHSMFMGTVKGVGGSLLRADPKQVGRFKIPLPSLEIQKSIAQILDNASVLRDRTKKLLGEYDLLAQSIFLNVFGDPILNEKGWNTLKLLEVTSKIGSGATPRGGKDSYKDEGISLIRSLNVHDNKFKMKDLAFIDDLQASELKNVTVKEKDVLINITGASVARCAIVPNKILPARVNQHVSILRCLRQKVNPIFLLHLIISPNSKIKLLGVGSSNGATRESITKSQLERFEIIVPPIKIQNLFAEKIDLIEKQKELAKNELKESEDLFNCLMQKAFKGELV